MSYQEYRQSLNQRLTEKVQRELSSLREKTQAKTPQEIYDAAYQIAMKNEISDCFSNVDYSPQAAKALMKSPNLLQDMLSKTKKVFTTPPTVLCSIASWELLYRTK